MWSILPKFKFSNYYVIMVSFLCCRYGRCIQNYLGVIITPQGNLFQLFAVFEITSQTMTLVPSFSSIHGGDPEIQTDSIMFNTDHSEMIGEPWKQ